VKKILLPFLLYTPLLFGQVVFEEVSQQIGITHLHSHGDKMGGGVAVFDFDNDGWEDIFFTGGEDADKLYRNLGNAGFEDVTVAAGISAFASIATFGVVTGDIDNDGFREILLTGMRNDPDVLLYNNGDGTFQQLTLPQTGQDYWSSAAAFADINLDGLLDIYITSYISEGGFIQDTAGAVVGFAHQCSANRLYMNNGNLTFSDATDMYALADTGCALAVAFSDFDNDRDADIVLANDFGEWGVPNGLFRNEYPQANFVDVSLPQNMNTPMYGMGVAIGDYDHDLDLDYYQTNLGINRLSRNDNGTFTDVTSAAGVENDSLNGLRTTGWGCFFADIDNDGWQDLYVANGHISAAAFIANVEFDPNTLYLNNGNGTFTDVTTVAGVGTTQKSRGAANADLNKDGLLDILVNNVDDNDNPAQVSVYANITENTNNWLRLKLRGVQSNRDAFGSQVRIVVGAEAWIQEVNGGSSHASQNSSIVHIGLGQTEIVDSIVVIFPSGIERIFTDVAANQLMEIVEDVTVGITEVSQLINVKLIYVNGQARLSFNMPNAENLLLMVYDASGRQITMENYRAVKGDNTIFLPTGLSSSVYFISINGNGANVFSTRWVVY